MIVTWIAVGLAVLILLQQVLTGRNFYRKIQEYEKENGKKLQCGSKSGKNRMIQVLPIIFCFLILIYITAINRTAVRDIPSYSAVCLILMAVFTGSLASSGMYQKIYYEEKGFFWNQRMILFTEMVSYTRKNRKRFEFKTKYGEIIVLTAVQGELLLELLQARKVRVRELVTEPYGGTYQGNALKQKQASVKRGRNTL